MADMSEIRHNDPVLCYVRGNCAYFTTRQLDKQWGDDWNDAPYEHNAGEPYTYARPDGKPWRKDETAEPWRIERLYFEAPMETPDGEVANSRWSVEQINAGAVAWLVTSRWGEWSGPSVVISAGTPMAEFKRLIRHVGGTVYVEEK